MFTSNKQKEAHWSCRLLNNNLLNTYYVPGTVPGLSHPRKRKNRPRPDHMDLTVEMGKIFNKRTPQIFNHKPESCEGEE